MQLGLSPKLVPTIYLAGLGLIVALVLDHDAGLAMLATAATALGTGYLRPPGDVVHTGRTGTPNDELLGNIEPPSR